VGETFLLTGAYGFIGAWIVKRLLTLDARVVIFDLATRYRVVVLTS
jgi:nucleoside-diphosphate-sugar epimerase